jgi:hypothetical protein
MVRPDRREWSYIFETIRHRLRDSPCSTATVGLASLTGVEGKPTAVKTARFTTAWELVVFLGVEKASRHGQRFAAAEWLGHNEPCEALKLDLIRHELVAPDRWTSQWPGHTRL